MTSKEVAECQARAIAAYENMFVTFKKPAGKVTPAEQENTEMHETAIRALERDTYDAYHTAGHQLAEKHHIHAHSPATIREFVDMVKAGEFENSKDDKFLDTKLGDYDCASHYLTMRKHPADTAAHEADTAKLREDYRAISLAVKTSTDPDKTRKETEHFRKTWVH